MSSNPLMMGYGGGDLLLTGAVWPMVGSLPRPVCAGCGQWPVWPAAPVSDESTLQVAWPPAWPPAFGVHDLYSASSCTPKCAIQIDSLYLLPSLPFEQQLADLSMLGGDADRRGVSTLSSSLHGGDISCGSNKSSWLTSFSACVDIWCHFNKTTLYQIGQYNCF